MNKNTVNGEHNVTLEKIDGFKYGYIIRVDGKSVMSKFIIHEEKLRDVTYDAETETLTFSYVGGETETIKLDSKNIYIEGNMVSAVELGRFAKDLVENTHLTAAYFLNHLDACGDNALERWTRLGLLEGLDDGMSRKVANLYETAARHIIYDQHNMLYNSKAVNWERIVFSIIRRIATRSGDQGEILNKLGMTGLEKLYIRFLVQHKDIDWEGIALKGVDVEAEHLAAFCRCGEEEDGKKSEWFPDWDFMVEAKKYLEEQQ